LAPIEAKHDEAELALEAAQTEAEHYQQLIQPSAHLRQRKPIWLGCRHGRCRSRAALPHLRSFS
jgi:hypothetical protein